MVFPIEYYKSFRGFKTLRLNSCLIVKKFASATAALKELGWLPVRYRIKFRVAVTVFKCLNNAAPDYLRELLTVHVPSRSLRYSTGSNSDLTALKVPFCKRSTF